MASYRLTLTTEQARVLRKAVELMARLKLNQHDVLPLEIADWGDPEDYCRRRDKAKPHLDAGFNALFEGKPLTEYKDAEWHELYGILQVVRHALWEVEAPDTWGVDSYEPMPTGWTLLPKIEILR